MTGRSIPRSDWESIVTAFAAFFDGLGAVTTSTEETSFTADPGVVDTGLTLRADGTSTSFMPLHHLAARWDEVTFGEATVTLNGAGARYTYRLPPALRRHPPA